MTTAEKLTAIAENEAKAREANKKLDLCLKGNKVDAKTEYLQNNVEEAVAAFNAISEEIVATGVEVEEGTKPRLLANKIPQVYEAGKKADYDARWDSFKDNQELMYRFAGVAWNDITFFPKNDIIAPVRNCSGMFYINKVSNLKERLLECGVIMDLSQCLNALNMFGYATTKELPEIDLSNCSNSQAVFANMPNLVNIDKVTFKDGVAFNNTFFNLPNLVEIRIGGTISGCGFDIHWSTKLSAESIDSIVRALSSTTTGLTITLPKDAWQTHATTYGAPNTNELWESKSNWTINELAV